jgi:hypothetical protein
LGEGTGSGSTREGGFVEDMSRSGAEWGTELAGCWLGEGSWLSSMFVIAEWNEFTLDKLVFGQCVLREEEFLVCLEGILCITVAAGGLWRVVVNCSGLTVIESSNVTIKGSCATFYVLVYIEY